MPAFRCCGTRVGDKFDLIDFDLPEEFRCNNEFRAKDCVDVSYENFVEYQKQLLLHPDLPGLTENDLQRAVEFFPCDFTPPLRKSDFAITIENKLVVSQRVLDVFSDLAANDFSTRQIHEDYFYVFVNKFGKPPLEQRLEGVKVCPKCGTPEGGKRVSYHIFEEDMWPESSIFSLGPGLDLFFTKELKESLDKIQPTNFRCEKVHVGESYRDYCRVAKKPTW